MKELHEIEKQQEAIRARLDEIATLPEPDGDEVSRAKTNDERGTEVDDLLALWDELEEKRVPLAARSKRLEAIRAKALDVRNTENGDGAAQKYLGSGPEVKRSADPFDGDPRMLGRQEVISRARTVLDAEDEVSISDASKAHVEKMLKRSGSREEEGEYQLDGSYIARRMLLTENEAYRSAFQKYARLGAAAAFTPSEQSAVAAYQDFEIRRAMSENTSSAGGVGIPVLIDPSIIVTSGAADVPMLRYCRIETVTNNLWQGVSSAGMTWAYSTEATEASDNSPTLAQPSVRVHAAKGFLPYSIEVSMDYPDFASEMGRLLDQGYQDLLANKTMTGSGTNEPFGIFNALDASTFDEVVTTTDGSFGGPDIFKVWNALPERYRSNATWVMSVAVQSAIRQFAASQSSTSAYFTIDLTGGEFRINDRPVILTDYAPTFSGAVPGTTGAQNILAVGDWRQTYLWVQRAGMSIEQVPLLFGGSNRFPTGQRGIYAWARNGGNVVNNLGARLLQNQ